MDVACAAAREGVTITGSVKRVRIYGKTRAKLEKRAGADSDYSANKPELRARPNEDIRMDDA